MKTSHPFICGRVFLVAAIGFVILYCASQIVAQSTQPTSTRSLVIIVPGNWGNAEFWPTIVPGMATFGSELQRAMGPGTDIYPFLWYGTNKLTSREIAAQSLASLIDQKAAQYDRIYLVGHSNGGNIALLAAGLCHTKIEMVVCMSTPHVYLEMRTAAGKLIFVPVYSTWETRQNANKIVNVFSGGDEVPNISAELHDVGEVAKLVEWAGITGILHIPPWAIGLSAAAADQSDKDLTEDDAIALTRSWQEHLGFPRLIDDTALGHALPNDMPRSIGLNIANANVKIQSFVVGGINQHSAIHSRRMGFLIGELIRDGMTRQRIQYLADMVQPADSDLGEPIDEDYQQLWIRTHQNNFDRVGWRLNQITGSLLPEANRVAHNLDGSLVSPYLRAGGGSGPNLGGFGGRGAGGGGLNLQQSFTSQVFLHTLSFKTPTNFILWNLKTEPIVVMAHHDNNLLARDNYLGAVLLTGADTPPPASIEADPAQSLYWSADLVWVPVHY